ncbi:hypothetical protein CAPTEDRAFT_205242 [Capitella teleta]|uniref:Methyltransferase FkbM domain-containing protein n=1 Tax=Capitella teleta TaxID=283909 RepID=R7VDT1_CAPTE|nr:hypothetical protein CAPTEDRAFT_205242 [Capitella teleta]|eukprot:ELU16779.1 hypothetical protein CAPTEDRAFT_205242 [Capitella teleta]
MVSGSRFTWQLIAGVFFVTTLVFMRSATVHPDRDELNVVGLVNSAAQRARTRARQYFKEKEEEKVEESAGLSSDFDEIPAEDNSSKEMEQQQVKKINFITATELLDFRKGHKMTDLTDESLLQFVRNQIVAPSTEPLHLFESHELDQSQAGQSKRVDEILNGRMDGFYVECGAAQGEGRSNTLYFERVRDWGGLLIEADPKAFTGLLMRNRHAYTTNVCLSPANHTKVMKFNVAGEGGGLVDTSRLGPGEMLSSGKGYVSQIQCFPIYSILLALNVKHIDYFSLDVEGAEVAILETFPWGAVTVDVWTVEYRTFNDSHLSREMTTDRYNQIKAVFEATGLYEPVGVLPQSESISTGLDAVFKRKQLVKGKRDRSSWY